VLLILISSWSLVTLANSAGTFKLTVLRSPKIKFANLNKVELYPQKHSPWDKSYNFCLNVSINGVCLSRADQTRNFTAISVGHNAVLLQDIVAKILGILLVPRGIASSTKVKGRNGERRKNQEKTF